MEKVPPVEMRNRATILDGAVWNIIDNFVRADSATTVWNAEKSLLLVESSGSYNRQPVECTIALRKLNGNAKYKVIVKSTSFTAVARILDLYQSVFSTNNHYHLFEASKFPFGIRIKGEFRLD